MDILCTALGTAEHGGRVRTAGHGVGLGDFYGRRRKSTGVHYSREELDEIVNSRVASVRDELRAEFQAERAEMMAEMRRIYEQNQSVHQEQQQQLAAEIEPRPNRASTRASCSPPRLDVEVGDVDWYTVASNVPLPDHGTWRIPMPSNPDMSISIDRTDLRFIFDRGEWLGECHLSLWLG